MKTLSQKILEVEKAPAAAVWRRPDSAVEDTPNWFQITTPSSQRYWFNGVQRSILNEQEAPAKVAEVAAGYRKRNQAFRWVVGPSARPAGLGSLLEQNGVKHHGTAIGMVAETESLSVQAKPDVRVEIVDLANIKDYVKASVTAWGNGEDVAKEMHADMVAALNDPGHPKLYYVAYLNNKPAGAAGLHLMKSSGYLIGGAVVTEFRRQGIYRSLVAKRLETLRSKKIPLATVVAGEETSAPICKQLGFESVCEIEFFVSEMPR